MKLLECPINGLRNINEFTYGGEVKQRMDPSLYSDREWAEFIFMEDNKLGVVKEWWFHNPSSYWFIAERNTQTDEIIRTYPPDEKIKMNL